MVQAAADRKRAILAFNVANLEMAQGVVSAARSLNCPVIIQFNRGGLAHIGGASSALPYSDRAIQGIPIAAAAVSLLAKRETIPVALHLDHADTIDELDEAIGCGFTSLMFDGSTHDLPTHIKLAKEARRISRRAGVPLEAELGHVSGCEEGVTIDQSSLTDPEDAIGFVEATEIDMLAVSIGNVHGNTPAGATLDFFRLEKIRSVVDVPLVLHGASGISFEQTREAVGYGIAKINIGTGLHRAFSAGVKGALNDFDEAQDSSNVVRALEIGRTAVKEFAHAQLSEQYVATCREI